MLCVVGLVVVGSTSLNLKIWYEQKTTDQRQALLAVLIYLTWAAFIALLVAATWTA